MGTCVDSEPGGGRICSDRVGVIGTTYRGIRGFGERGIETWMLVVFEVVSDCNGREVVWS